MKAFFAQAPLWSDGIELAIGERGYQSGSERSRVTHAVALTLNPIAEGDFVEPTMRLTKDEARELLDALWRVGIRPSNGEGNAGQLGATERHLADMRRLVFDASTSSKA
jgi:hypothetical protein